MNYELLIQKREAKGLTQHDMAIQLGYRSKSSYCMIENGNVGVTVNLAKRIKSILQLSDTEFNAIFFNDEVQVS